MHRSSDFQFLCYNSYTVYAADGLSGSASVRLLRLARQACAVELEHQYCSAVAAHEYSESAFSVGTGCVIWNSSFLMLNLPIINYSRIIGTVLVTCARSRA